MIETAMIHNPSIIACAYAIPAIDGPDPKALP